VASDDAGGIVGLMAATWLAAPVIAYLPGAVAFRLPWFDRPRRAALAADERAFWAIILSVAWSLVVVLALAGVGRYTFDRLVGIDVGVSIVGVLGWRGRLHYTPDEHAPRPSWSVLVPLALVALGCWLYFPASEYVLGGKDPGTYLNEGIQIAQRGSLTIDEPVIATVPEPYRALFFPPTRRQEEYYGLRFMGFFIQDPAIGRTIGQFPHLFPASIAIGYGLHGLTGARDATGVWAILGLLAVYFTVTRLFGRAAGAATAALTGLNIIELWFGRYPNSEVVMQALLFAAMLAFARAVEGSRVFFGVVAAGLLGLMIFLRYEIVLAFLAFATAATIVRATRDRIGPAFWIALAAGGAIGLSYLKGPMRAYSAYPLGFTRAAGGWWLAAALVVVAWGVRRLLRREAVANVVRRLVPPALAVSLAALAIYAYFFREPGGRLALGDAMAFRTFGWYLSPAVLGVASAAGTIVIALCFWRDPVFFLTFTVFSVFFFYKTRIVPEHFWTARRFLAVALPGTLMFIAVAGAWIANRITGTTPLGGRARATIGAVILTALVAPVAIVFWRADAPVRHHVEYAGLIGHLESLAARIGPRDLLLVESRNAGSDLHTIAVPLAYIYARQVLVLDSATPAKQILDGFVSWAETHYDRVLFLGGGGTDLLSRRLLASPLASGAFHVPEYDSPMNAYPSGVRRKDFEYGLYRLTTGERPAAAMVDQRVGVLDDLNVVRFYAKERRPDTGEPFRWSGRQSFVLLVGINADARRVTVWMSNGGRPATAAPATVEVALDDRVIGTATPRDAIEPFTFTLPADLAVEAAARPTPARLRLRVPTWNPKALLGVEDTRDLGVIVTRVVVE
jgi:hypothetical protein